MPTAALLTTATEREQPECPSAEAWLKKLWDLNSTEYYSAIKKIIVCSLGQKRVEPKMIMFREVKR